MDDRIQPGSEPRPPHRHHHDRPATGQPRRIEIVFHNFDGRLYISGTPRADRTRAWLAQPRSRPAFHVPPQGRADGRPAGDRPDHHRRDRAPSRPDRCRTGLDEPGPRGDGPLQPAHRGHDRGPRCLTLLGALNLGSVPDPADLAAPVPHPKPPRPRRSRKFVLPEHHHDEQVDDRAAERIEAFIEGPDATPRRRVRRRSRANAARSSSTPDPIGPPPSGMRAHVTLATAGRPRSC